MARQDIFDQIDIERNYQDGKFGEEADNQNTASDWITYITSYASREYQYPVNPTDFRNNMIKTAALAVAAIESLDRQAPGILMEVN